MKFKKLKKRILCPDCKTGQESLVIDPSSVTCPYISCYDGVRCSYYVPIKEKKTLFSFFKKK